MTVADIPRPTDRWTGAWAAVVLAALALAYGAVWQAGFVWDDDLHVTANPTIIGPQGLREIWTTRSANYFPLTLTSFRALHAVWGLNPLPYHLVNVGLHFGGAFLLWRLLRRLGVPGAWLGAAAWAVHPVQAESVAWISQLKNTQSGVFFLLSIHAYLHWLDARRADRAGLGWYALVLGTGFLAFASKSSTVMLPVVLGLVAFRRNRRWRLQDWIPLVPLLIGAALFSELTIWDQKVHAGASGTEWTMTAGQRLILAGRLPWFYLGKLLWPADLAFVYPRWEINPAQVASYLPLAATGLVTLAVWRWRREAAWAAIAWGAFLALLFPVLGFFDVYYFRYAFAADHFQYLASMVPLGLAGSAGVWLVGWLGAGRRVLTVAATIWIAGLTLVTTSRARIYHDVSTLWRATLMTNPACWLAWNNLGRLERAATGARGARPYYERAVALRPGFAEAQYNLGTACSDLGDDERALVHLRQAVALNPSLADAHNNLANVLARRGARAEAIREYAVALTLHPEAAYIWKNLGVALSAAGRAAEAVRPFATVVRLEPGSPEAHFNLGNALLAVGRLDDAVRSYQNAVALRPDFAAALANLGSALLQQGGITESIAAYERSIRANPNIPEVHSNFALALRRAGRIDDAMKEEQLAKPRAGRR